MIKIDDNWEVVGLEHAIRGMRNPMNSWNKSDSGYEPANFCDSSFHVGDADLELMRKLSKAGTDHRKFMRMMVVYADVTAPLYWWKECDTYKVGTVANSCSTMHKLHERDLTIDDFSHDHMTAYGEMALESLIATINESRALYVTLKDKESWYEMIQLLPSSYNQKRTIMLNYEVLANIYKSRKCHKLDEWRNFCKWIEQLPYSEIITDVM